MAAKAEDGILKLRLRGLATFTGTEKIKNYFYSREPDLKEVLVEIESEDTAIVELFGPLKDVQGLLRQPKHRLTVDHYFTVETFSQQSSLGPPSEIVVTVLNGANISEDKIKGYLESSESGGVNKKQVLRIKLISEGVYQVQMSNIEDCHQIVSKRGGHNIKETVLNIYSMDQHHPLPQTTLLSSNSSASYLPALSCSVDNTFSPFTSSFYAQSHVHVADSPVFTMASSDTLLASRTSDSYPTSLKFSDQPTNVNFSRPYITGSLASTNDPSNNTTSWGVPLQQSNLAYSSQPPPKQLIANSAPFPHAPTTAIPLYRSGDALSSQPRPAGRVTSKLQAEAYSEPPLQAGLNILSTPSRLQADLPNSSEVQATPQLSQDCYSPITGYQSSSYSGHGSIAPYLIHSHPQTNFIAGLSHPPSGRYMSSNAYLHSSQYTCHAENPSSYPPAPAATHHPSLQTTLQRVPHHLPNQHEGTFPTSYSYDHMHSSGAVHASVQSPSDFSVPRKVTSHSSSTDDEINTTPSINVASHHAKKSVADDFCSNCLIISDVPPDHNEQSVIFVIEDELELEEEDFTLQSCKGFYRLRFHNRTYNRQELAKMAELLKNKVNFSAKCCEPSRIIRVENISSEGFMNKQALRRYFEKPSRSGGGTIESIEEVEGDNYAFHVTFQDYKVISSVIKKKHTMLGSRVKLTIVDPFQSDDESDTSSEDTSESIEPPRTIVVSGVTKKKFRNEKALKSYFESPQSGGGEVDKIEYSKGKAVITFRDPHVISNVMHIEHSQLGSNIRLSLEDDSNLSVPQEPLSYPVETVVARYLQSVPELFVSQLQVKAKVDASNKFIVVTPTSSSLTDWQETCQESLTTFINENVEIASFPLVEEVRGKIFAAVIKHSQQKELCFEIDSKETTILVAGSATAIASLKISIEELHATFVMKEDSILFDDAASLAYFENCRLTVVKAQYPNVRISLNHAKQSLDVYGSIRDLKELWNRFPGFCKHSHIFLQLQMVQLKFLSRVPFQDVISGLPNVSVVVPFLQMSPSGDAECFFLLYSDQDEHAAHKIAKSITDKLNLEQFDLPKSFSSTAIVNSTDFQALVQRLQAAHMFEYDFHDNLLMVVGLDNSAAEVGHFLIDHIRESCATTQDVLFNSGMWRFINSRLKQKWTIFLDQVKGIGVQIFEPAFAKQADSVQKLELKGEPEVVAVAGTYIQEIKSCVKTGSLHFERPGLSKFFKDSQGQDLLKGIEASSCVCIEMSTEKKQTQKGFQECAQFVKICSGTTAEFKSVHVYIGDITLFNKADVIVNAANESLQHNGGVALAISQKGGPEIQKDSDDFIQRNGTVEAGSAILLEQTGMLPPSFKAIVHAVGPQWDPNSSDRHVKEIAILKKTCRKALAAASAYGSIALPAISCGAFGFPPDVCADSLLKGVVEFSEQNPTVNLDTIYFIILQDNVPSFQKATKAYLPHSSSTIHEKKSIHSKSANPLASDSSTQIRRKRTRKTSSTPKNQPGILQHIKITNESILDVQVDALVYSTNCTCNFESGGFLAKKILKAAGDKFKDECARKGPIPVGGVAVTGAGNLQCKYVMHVVLPDYDGPGRQAEKMLRKVVQSCLQECTKLNLTSIAFPSIGAGTLNYKDEVVASCLLEEVVSYLESHQGTTSIRQVQFVIFSKRTYQAFRQHFKTMSSLATKNTGLVSQASAKNDDQELSSFSQHEQIVFRIGLDQVMVILRGDISDNDSDVIVNTTNDQLILNEAGAVSAAILEKGGTSLQAACNRALGQGNTLAEGKVVITKATGTLKCREVFHVYFTSKDDEKFVETILTCLQKAEAKKYKSIAFPAIGTGKGGYSPASAANGIVQAVEKFTSTNPTCLRTIRIILFQQQLYQQFVEAFQAMGNEDDDGGWFLYVTAAAIDVAKVVMHKIRQAKLPSYFRKQSSEPSEDTFENENPKTVYVANAVVFTIYGETERAVELAENKIKDALKTQIVTQKIEDPEIGYLQQSVVAKLEREALEWQVHIETDVDPGLHTIKLHGCLADVLMVKDKIREELFDSKQKKSLLKAADAVYLRIRWTRKLPDDNEEYDVMTNNEIEEAYQQKKPTYICENEFMIDFSRMQETELDSGDRVDVYRNDLALAEKPAEWDPMPIDPKTNKEAHVHLVSLTPGCSEYGQVEDEFTATMMVGTNFSQIVSIERVQNPILFGQYIARKKQMDKHNPKTAKNERWLFHGTTAEACPNINTQGFNRMFRGKNGVKYGQGVYFATEATYSDRYADPDIQGEKRMYLTYVLVGEYTQGIEGRLLPPPKKPQINATVLFDSTVDSMANPSIFVVYYDAQNYPAYLITYT